MAAAPLTPAAPRARYRSNGRRARGGAQPISGAFAAGRAGAAVGGGKRRGADAVGAGRDPGWGSAGREGAAGEPLLAREPSAWRVARERQLPLS